MASATQAGTDICDRAAAKIADEAGVPLRVLLAITRTETGRPGPAGLEPWPWTVNMEGAGKWFDTRERALDFVRQSQARGARSFDIGCFQINHRWHGDGFASIEAMFDPVINARYAARFLRDLYDELGDWVRAAGAYHSRNETYAGRYRSRFTRILARLNDDPVATALAASEPAASAPVRAAFPFMTGGAAGRLGSLLPANIRAASGRLIGS